MEAKYSLQDVATMLGLSRNTLLNWQRNNQIPKYPTDPQHQTAKHLTREDLQMIACAAIESFKVDARRAFAKVDYEKEMAENSHRAEFLSGETEFSLMGLQTLIDKGWPLSKLTIQVLFLELAEVADDQLLGIEILNLVMADRTAKYKKSNLRPKTQAQTSSGN